MTAPMARCFFVRGYRGGKSKLPKWLEKLEGPQRPRFHYSADPSYNPLTLSSLSVSATTPCPTGIQRPGTSRRSRAASPAMPKTTKAKRTAARSRLHALRIRTYSEAEDLFLDLEKGPFEDLEVDDPIGDTPRAPLQRHDPPLKTRRPPKRP